MKLNKRRRMTFAALIVSVSASLVCFMDIFENAASSARLISLYFIGIVTGIVIYQTVQQSQKIRKGGNESD